MPRIGDKTPAFTAKTTQGDIAFPDDFAGDLGRRGREGHRERVT
jgi:alkyl hydroperoxide reductase subunit AhpC